MSQENVEVARHWIEAYKGRDMERLVELVTPEFVFRSIFVAVETEFRVETFNDRAQGLEAIGMSE